MFLQLVLWIGVFSMSAGYKLIESAWRCSERGDYNRGLKLASEALELAKSEENVVLRSHAFGTLGNILYGTGRFDEAIQCYAKALPIIEKIADRPIF